MDDNGHKAVTIVKRIQFQIYWAFVYLKLSIGVLIILNFYSFMIRSLNEVSLQEYISNYFKAPDNNWTIWNIFTNGLKYKLCHFDVPVVFWISKICTDLTPLVLEELYLLIRISNGAVGSLKIKKIAVFFTIFCVITGLIVCISVSGILHVAHSFVEDKLMSLVDTHVVVATNELKNISKIHETYKHPLGYDKNPPFYLGKAYRYPMEDVLFQCKYAMFKPGGYPQTSSFTWKKNGVTVEPSYRVLLDVSIQSNVSPSNFYIITSTLSIYLINESDYGCYTCNYKKLLSVFPEHTRYYDNLFSPGTLLPVSNETKCGCQRSVIAGHMSFLIHFGIPFCFAEFELIKSPQDATVPIQISPGGILIDYAKYWTLADKEDVFVYHSDKGSDHENITCCSLLVKLYLFVFIRGYLNQLPITQQIENEQFIYPITWMCMCNSSFGIKNYTIFRQIYNSAVKRHELVEIDFPVKLLLHSTLNDNEALSLSFWTEKIHNFYFCSVIDYLTENSVYSLYLNDLIAVILAFLVLYMTKIVIFWPINHITRPMYRLFMFMPPTNQLETAHEKHDIFLSYNEEEAYDTQVAKLVKDILSDLGLIVFDPGLDILPGHPSSLEISAAIENSRRFIALASKSYTDDKQRRIELFLIRDEILHSEPYYRSTEMQNRFLVIKLDSCEITGIRQAQCISVPDGMKEKCQIDVDSLCQLMKWELSTRPLKKGRIKHVLSKLIQSGFSWKSVFIGFVLIFFACKSLEKNIF